jgi:hypothetical protein
MHLVNAPIIRSHIVAVLLMLTIPGVVIAAESDRPTTAEARQAAASWLGRWQEFDRASAVPVAVAGRVELRDADSGQTLAHCFRLAPEGFLVMAGHKDLAPVVCYSATGSFDPGSEDGFVQLVRERLQRRTAAVEVAGRVAANRERWMQLLDADKDAPPGESRDAGPLLTTDWIQRAPFNQLCPEGDGGTCLVGCVATAASQIMAYHQWPPQGFGSVSYFWNGDDSCGGSTPGDTLSADLSDPYDWEAVAQGSGGAYEAAVAEICYEVGVAFSMGYGKCVSIANSGSVLTVLPQRFRYRPTIRNHRGREHGADAWFALIQAEIDALRPIHYVYPGHALVCDGWRLVDGQKQIHLNYGWGASYSAWYVMDEIIGHDGGHEDESMYAGIEPEDVLMLTPDGQGDYSSLEAAVHAAADGQVIRLWDGIYAGRGNQDVDFRGKQLRLESLTGEPGGCVIDVQAGPDDPHRALVFQSGEDQRSVIRGLTFTGAWYDSPGGAIQCRGGMPSIERCVFYGNRSAQSGGAIAVSGELPPAPGGIVACTFAVNDGGGMTFFTGPVAVEQCLVTGSVGGPAVYLAMPGLAILSACDLFDNAGGDWVDDVAEQAELRFNFSADPLYCDITAPDVLTLSTPSPCLPENNASALRIGAHDEGCLDYVVYADGSGLYATIQAAMDEAIFGGSVVLADGVYTGPGNTGLVTSGRNLTFRSASGDAAACEIRCGGDDEPGRALVVTGGSVQLKGLTIGGARVDDDEGGAVLVSGGGTLVIDSCRIVDNRAARGGAVALQAGAQVFCGLSVFQGNDATEEGGVFAGSEGAYLGVYFSTLAANTAPTGCHISVPTGATVLLVQSLLAFGEGGMPVNATAGAATASCTDIFGHAGGDWTGALEPFMGISGNISADPLFCDMEAGDLHVAEGSPCLELGGCSYPATDVIGALGVGCVSPVGVDDGASSPPGLRVSGLYPNPFNPATEIIFNIGRAGPVKVAIHDVRGRRVRELVSDELSAGEHRIRWDGRDDRGAVAAAGVYLARVTWRGETETVKMALLK